MTQSCDTVPDPSVLSGALCACMCVCGLVNPTLWGQLCGGGRILKSHRS